MKICVVNLTTKDIAEDVRESNLNKVEYCEKHSLHHRFYLGRASKRHAQWDKIQCLMQNLAEYDYVVWIDSDAVFNNFDTSLKRLIEENSEYDALFCSDVCYSEGQNHLLINSGVMIFKNTQWSFQFLSKVWHSAEDYTVENLNKHSYEGFPHEQGKLCEILLREDQDKFKIFQSEVFNQHPNYASDQTFIVHFMGSRQTEEHIETFRRRVREINEKLNIDASSDIDYIELNPLRICVVSLYTENIKDVAEVTVPNKEQYCSKHGYSFFVKEGRLSLRHPGWDKIKLISGKMEEEFDYFVWIDNDAYITNQDIRLDFICLNHGDINLIICSESEPLDRLDPSTDFGKLANLRFVNSGVFIIKNNGWGRQFLDEVWVTRSNTNQGIEASHAEIHSNIFTYDFWPFEQGPLHIVLSKRNPEDYKILASNVMNSFSTRHSKQDFICHFVGNHNNASNIIDYVQNLNEDIAEKTLLKEGEKKINFRGQMCYLTYRIYENGENILLKYSWDFRNTKEKNLSHCFRINGRREICFGSESTGRLICGHGDTIEHSYEWFGEKEWCRLSIH